MENLPQELVNRIVWFSERYPDQDAWCPAIGQSYQGQPSAFPRLAGLDRRWKEAIETITFRHLVIKSNELDSLQSIVRGSRRKALRKIGFKPLLPAYSDEACARDESQEDRDANDEAFSEGIRHLFAVLRTWEDEHVQSALAIDILPPAAPTDSRIYASARARNQLMHEIHMGRREDIVWDRWRNSCVGFVRRGKLPTLRSVRHLAVRGSEERKLLPCVAPMLAMSLPALTTVEWKFQNCDGGLDDEADDDSLDASDSDSEPEPGPDELVTSPKARCEARLAFANMLNETELGALECAKIEFYHEASSHQNHTYPSIGPWGLAYDPLSTAMRTFSQRLTTLTLSAHVDSTLFWPHEPSAAPPFWPCLKSLDVAFSMVAPCGAWYFTGPQAIEAAHGDASTYSEFRIHPAARTFDPFLAALAKAVAQMPVLESLMLTCELMGDTGRLHICYHAPGRKSDWADERLEDVGRRRIYYACEVGELWVPEPDTAAGLRRAGAEKFGGEVVERYLGSQYLPRHQRRPV
jgi:hypothetical protein